MQLDEGEHHIMPMKELVTSACDCTFFSWTFCQCVHIYCQLWLCDLLPEPEPLSRNQQVYCLLVHLVTQVRFDLYLNI